MCKRLWKMEVSEKLHSKQRMSMTAFLFVANQLAGSFDNIGKFYFVFATDIVIPCNYVKR